MCRHFAVPICWESEARTWLSLLCQLHLPSLVGCPVILVVCSPTPPCHCSYCLLYLGPSPTMVLLLWLTPRLLSQSSLGWIPGLGSCISLEAWKYIYLCSTHNVWKWSLGGGGAFSSPCYLMREFLQDKRKRKWSKVSCGWNIIYGWIISAKRRQ